MFKDIFKTCPFIKDEKSIISDKCELPSTKTEKSQVKSVKIHFSDSKDIRKSTEITHIQTSCYETSKKPMIIENFLLEIENDDYSELTNIVSTSKLLQRYENYVTSNFHLFLVF